MWAINLACTLGLEVSSAFSIFACAWRRLVVARSVVFVGAAVFLAQIGPASTSNAQVIPPNDPVAGQAQLDLANRWWPWVINVPIAVNPLEQSGNIGPVAGDQGSVFFLAGSTGNDPVTRNVTIPANKPLFFPLVTTNADNVSVAGDPPSTFTAAQLLTFITPTHNNATGLFLEIDGVPAANLQSHRKATLAAAPYSYTTTSSDNVIDAVFGGDSTLGTGVYPSTVTPAVQDGYWVAIQGFAAGTTHTLHFGGMIDFDPTAPGGEVRQDITYNLTVVPEPSTISSLAVCLLVLAGLRRWRRAGL